MRFMGIFPILLLRIFIKMKFLSMKRRHPSASYEESTWSTCSVISHWFIIEVVKANSGIITTLVGRSLTDRLCLQVFNEDLLAIKTTRLADNVFTICLEVKCPKVQRGLWEIIKYWFEESLIWTCILWLHTYLIFTSSNFFLNFLFSFSPFCVFLFLSSSVLFMIIFT